MTASERIRKARVLDALGYPKGTLVPSYTVPCAGRTAVSSNGCQGWALNGGVK